MIPLPTQSQTLYPFFFSLLILFKAQNTMVVINIYDFALANDNIFPVCTPLGVKGLRILGWVNNVACGFLESFSISVQCSQACSGHQYQVNKHFLLMEQVSVWLDGLERWINRNKARFNFDEDDVLHGPSHTAHGTLFMAFFVVVPRELNSIKKLSVKRRNTNRDRNCAEVHHSKRWFCYISCIDLFSFFDHFL